MYLGGDFLWEWEKGKKKTKDFRLFVTLLPSSFLVGAAS